ncbi:MAG TPA: hypothetical protein VHD63_00595, partial [Ktedonobacteraceae bacterium]|nr:hypothetical protein [Ktedonobacteraceae bacterium]
PPNLIISLGWGGETRLVVLGKVGMTDISGVGGIPGNRSKNIGRWKSGILKRDEGLLADWRQCDKL